MRFCTGTKSMHGALCDTIETIPPKNKRTPNRSEWKRISLFFFPHLLTTKISCVLSLPFNLARNLDEADDTEFSALLSPRCVTLTYTHADIAILNRSKISSKVSKAPISDLLMVVKLEFFNVRLSYSKLDWSSQMNSMMYAISRPNERFSSNCEVRVPRLQSSDDCRYKSQTSVPIDGSMLFSSIESRRMRNTYIRNRDFNAKPLI